MFLFKKKYPGSKKPKEVKAQVIAVWSPPGNNTTKFSLELARELAKHTRILLVELPCLGIPRLGFTANIMERDNHTEALILELDKKGEINLDRAPRMGDSLTVLAASVFAFPDYPVSHKVELETLIGFPAEVVNRALQDGYSIVVFDCQGQVTTPMTHFALKHADRVFIPVTEHGGLAFSLLNVKRLVQVFKYGAEKFKLLARENVETIAEVAVIKDEEGREACRLDVLNENSREIAQELLAATQEDTGAVALTEEEDGIIIRL
ncbi:MAG: hypothetical protein QHH10_14275 [Peptococcaceae bacterium]|jgi:pilus assembly protein CpaF|nr:hypothetical protein [Peptococcaceae bacterium]MDH7526460.1 hypothetical protein [Peptococcaceae bacterium]